MPAPWLAISRSPAQLACLRRAPSPRWARSPRRVRSPPRAAPLCRTECPPPATSPLRVQFPLREECLPTWECLRLLECLRLSGCLRPWECLRLEESSYCLHGWSQFTSPALLNAATSARYDSPALLTVHWSAPSVDCCGNRAPKHRRKDPSMRATVELHPRPPVCTSPSTRAKLPLQRGGGRPPRPASTGAPETPDPTRSQVGPLQTRRSTTQCRPWPREGGHA